MRTTFAAALAAATASAIPTAIFHGLGDACIYPGMHHFSKEIANGTGDYAKCLEVGNGSITSITDNFMDQAEKACNKLLADEKFAVDEINVMGLSQGALLARYIVESCPIKGKVRNLSSIGGPNMGVIDIPHCFSGPFCKLINSVARDFVYTGIVQNILGPAGYFRDTYHYDRYLNRSVFLPHLNNEAADDDATKAARKDRFSSLNGLQLMMFTQDTMVFPKESEWFQELDESGELRDVTESDFYKNDVLGFKTLNEAKKVQFVSVDGDHLQFSQDDINNTIVPFLLS